MFIDIYPHIKFPDGGDSWTFEKEKIEEETPKDDDHNHDEQNYDSLFDD